MKAQQSSLECPEIEMDTKSSLNNNKISNFLKWQSMPVFVKSHGCDLKFGNGKCSD